MRRHLAARSDARRPARAAAARPTRARRGASGAAAAACPRRARARARRRGSRRATASRRGPSSAETVPMCMWPPLRQRRLLAVERERAARDRVVLERAPHQAGGRDRTAVVGEGGGACVGELAHLGQLRALLADRDRGGEADRHLGLLGRPRAQAAQHVGRVDDRRRCSASRGSRSSRPPRPPPCRRRSSPRPRGRACAGGRAGRRTPARARAQRRRSRGGRSRRATLPSWAIVPPSTRTSSTASTPPAGSSTRAPRTTRSSRALLADEKHHAHLHGRLDRDRARRQQVVEHRHPHDEAGAHLIDDERVGGVGDARVDLDAAVHRPRVHHLLPGPQPLGGDAPARAVLAQRGHVVRALLHPLALHAQDVDDVGVADRVDVVRDSPSSARHERRRADERDAARRRGGAPGRASARRASGGRRRRSRRGRPRAGRAPPGSCRGRAAPASGAGACRRRRSRRAPR